MAIQLPRIISEYFAADKAGGADAVAHCFTEHAVVRDEGNIYAGRDAIRQWKADSTQKYTYTAEPFSIARDGDRLVVTSRLVGDFPGSPIDLRYLFVLEDEKIGALEIIP
ncbi:nuclear transport factor 2 family protein [Aquabacter spiritensis]|uniref:SnoaL-like protein n=1 Tax=Aquabacter spiritensis TaxID=933073 RepID=A0A4R3M872_9HYPH|nr:nuclear transport factor 2 family protein [Aquabacter spiritensis]TCT07837.1 SnoaL-like protein [Aquabacter spiritensis]